MVDPMMKIWPVNIFRPPVAAATVRFKAAIVLLLVKVLLPLCLDVLCLILVK